MNLLPHPQGEKFLYSVKNKDTGINLPYPRVGDLFKQDYSHGQFSGSWTYRITRVTVLGDVFGVYHSGNVYEMGIEDCM